jgi:hypothetical protein
MAKTAVGLFENRATAKSVVSDLERCGLPAGKIRVLGGPMGFGSPGSLSTGHAAFKVDSSRELERIGATRLEVEAYLHGLRRGRVIVLAPASDGKVDAAVRVMNGIASSHLGTRHTRHFHDGSDFPCR